MAPGPDSFNLDRRATIHSRGRSSTGGCFGCYNEQGASTAAQLLAAWLLSVLDALGRGRTYLRTGRTSQTSRSCRNGIRYRLLTAGQSTCSDLLYAGYLSGDGNFHLQLQADRPSMVKNPSMVGDAGHFANERLFRAYIANRKQTISKAERVSVPGS